MLSRPALPDQTTHRPGADRSRKAGRGPPRARSPRSALPPRRSVRSCPSRPPPCPPDDSEALPSARAGAPRPPPGPGGDRCAPGAPGASGVLCCPFLSCVEPIGFAPSIPLRGLASFRLARSRPSRRPDGRSVRLRCAPVRRPIAGQLPLRTSSRLASLRWPAGRNWLRFASADRRVAAPAIASRCASVRPRCARQLFLKLLLRSGLWWGAWLRFVELQPGIGFVSSRPERSRCRPIRARCEPHGALPVRLGAPPRPGPSAGPFGVRVEPDWLRFVTNPGLLVPRRFARSTRPDCQRRGLPPSLSDPPLAPGPPDLDGRRTTRGDCSPPHYYRESPPPQSHELPRRGGRACPPACPGCHGG